MVCSVECYMDYPFPCCPLHPRWRLMEACIGTLFSTAFLWLGATKCGFFPQTDSNSGGTYGLQGYDGAEVCQG